MKQSKPRHQNAATCFKCLEILTTAHPDLQKLADDVRAANPEAHVAWAVRGKADQEDAKRRGTSRASFGESPHNYVPSLAIDFFRITPNGVAEWNKAWFTEHIAPFARRHGFEWGGDFLRFQDAPHVQIKNWKAQAKKLAK
jgi:hypothetical protein